MKKLLMFLGMVLLAAGFITVGESKAGNCYLISPSDEAQLAVYGPTCGVLLDYEFDVSGSLSLADYFVYVDDDSDFSSPDGEIVDYVDDGDFTSFVSGLAPGETYYWKVVAVYNEPWPVFYSTAISSTRSFIFIVPGLISPANGATDQSTSPLLDWASVFPGLVLGTGYHILVDDNSDFSSPEIDNSSGGSSHSPDLDYFTTYYWKVRSYTVSPYWPNPTTYYNWSARWEFTTEMAWLCGDVNADAAVNILDIVYIINYKYKGGPAPDPIESGDVNSYLQPDGLINILDVVYLINYKYKSGPEPVCP